MTVEYEPIIPAPNLSQGGLEQAVIQLGPAWTYHLRVHPTMVFEAKNLLRSLAAQSLANPFSPYVNVSADGELGVLQWYLAIEGQPRKVGSDAYQ